MSVDEERLREAARWLRYAREDFRAAEALAEDPDVAPRQVCWLSQQAAEKALKGALCFLDRDFPRTHNLDALRNLLPGDWAVRREEVDLAPLTAWAVEARYPGDWPEATPADGRSALEMARTVLFLVQRDLSRRGFPEHW